MTSPSPLLRLFAVCWWLVVIGSGGLALLGTWAVWEHLSEASLIAGHWRVGPLPHPTSPGMSRPALSSCCSHCCRCSS
jgi:hypothetical protein